MSDPKPALEQAEQDLDDAEKELILSMFRDLKSQTHECELRVAVKIDPETRRIEIIYAGLHKKWPLNVLRRMYDIRRKLVKDMRVSA